MAALQTSKYVNVVDEKHIRRKFDEKHIRRQADDENSEDGKDFAWDPNDDKKLFVAPSARKSAKKMVGTWQSSLVIANLFQSEATGFEDLFADAPITPDEHADNIDCYHPDRAIHDRLEVAIQRYKARRKFHNSHTIAFNSWLKFGGVETGERKFNGKLDNKEEFAGMSAFEKAVQYATHQVGEDKADDKQWTLDFVGVAKAFL